MPRPSILVSRLSPRLPPLLGPLLALSAAACAASTAEPAPGAEDVGAAAEPLSVTCKQIQRGAFGTVTDAAADSLHGTTNYGAFTAVSTGLVDGATRYGLFRFDLASIPPGAKISSATLGLSLYAASTGIGTLNAHRITAPWSESTATWTTFNKAFDPTIAASAPNSAPSFDLKPLVSQWVSGATPNNGVLLEQSTWKTIFNASEATVVASRPFLNVCYDTCTDGVKDGAETAVDCGGACALKCAAGGGCSVAADCQSNVCVGGLCQGTSCSDEVKNGAETAVDCGGGACLRCTLGAACAINADCATGNCQAGACQPLPVVSSGCVVPAVSSNLITSMGLTYSTPVGFGATYANKLDIYRINDSANRPLVVFIHGGGWRGGGRAEASVVSNCQLLATLGFVCASIDYRLDLASGAQTVPAYFPSHEADTRCAVRWLRNNAAAYHIDPSRVFAMGISAGAHLAVSLAVDAELSAFDDGSCSTATSARVDGAIGSFGVYDMRSTASATWGNPASSPAPADITNFVHGGDAALASPILHLGPTDAPVLLLHGGADTVLYPAASQLMSTAAASAGVAATLWVEPTALHGYHWWDPGYSGSACTLMSFLAGTAPIHP